MNIKTASTKAAVPVLAVVHGLMALPPVLLTGCLYRLAQRAASLLGHWPVPWIDDPKWIGPKDVVYQYRYDVVEQVNSIAFCSFTAWFLASAILYRFYSRRIRLLQALLFALTWGFLWLNPWQLLKWWLD